MKQISAYLTAIMIALAGLGMLVFSVWFIVKYPVPHPLQPLKHRIAVILQLEQARQEIVLEQETVLYSEPDQDSLEIDKVPSGKYRKLQEQGEWILIEFNNNQGWINKNPKVVN